MFPSLLQNGGPAANNGELDCSDSRDRRADFRRLRLINRTAEENSFLFFANIAVSSNENYQVLFPPDVQWVTYHGKHEFSKWPVADSIYHGVDFRGGVDVSWWKNHPSPISMFVMDSDMDFVGGYDHGRRAGMVHVADHHISPGKKFFTWGAGEAGQAWDRALTDDDGPYIELMAGSFGKEPRGCPEARRHPCPRDRVAC